MVARMRILMWAAVALIALVVLQLRPDEPSGATTWRPLNGKTSQGQALWAIERGGKVRVVELGWRFRCDNGWAERTASRFEVGSETFQYDGRRFTAKDVSPRPPHGDGWDAMFRAELRGELSGDRDTARGTGHATVTWVETATRTTVECTTGEVTFTVRR